MSNVRSRQHDMGRCKIHAQQVHREQQPSYQLETSVDAGRQVDNMPGLGFAVAVHVVQRGAENLAVVAIGAGLPRAGDTCTHFRLFVKTRATTLESTLAPRRNLSPVECADVEA